MSTLAAPDLAISVRLYDGAEITHPMPAGADWTHAAECVTELRRRFTGVVARAEIVSTRRPTLAMTTPRRSMAGVR